MFSFKLIKQSGKARLGKIKTNHGKIMTPVFMPVGTLAAVKTLSPKDLEEVGAQIVLSNTYHLHLRPGEKLIKKAGGLHKFMNWPKPILTDSGGFQVFSLSNLRRVTNSGVEFKSHLDGKKIFLTPKLATKIQEDLGADIIMAFDDVVGYPASREKTEQAMERTHRWLKECIVAHKKKDQALFGIIQGGMFDDLRKESAEFVSKQKLDGIAIGGLSVGESREKMCKMLDLVEPILPEDKPRYVMGIGTPVDLLEAVDRGMDMFDCVLATRLARHGAVWTKKGKLNLFNSKFRSLLSPIENKCQCYTCQNFTTAYLHHLLKEKEVLGIRLLAIHNLHFLFKLMADIRESIRKRTFTTFKRQFLKQFGN